MADMTQLTGDYAASWLPWLMIPLIFYILPFPIFALAFLWIEQEGATNQFDTVTINASSEATLTASSTGEIPELEQTAVMEDTNASR